MWEDINDKESYIKRGKNIRVNKRYLTDFKNKKNVKLYSKDKEVLIINKKKNTLHQNHHIIELEI